MRQLLFVVLLLFPTFCENALLYLLFFVKNKNIYVKKGKIVFSIKLYSCLKEIILSE